jgi:hypothetical protein
MSPTIYPDPPAPEEPEYNARDESPYAEDEEWESPFAARQRREPNARRSVTSDPVFGYLIALALCIGLMPVIPNDPALRYTVLWAVIAGFGVLAWLLGSSARVGTDTLENVSWGVIFALIIGVPFLIFGGSLLRQMAHLLFAGMTTGETLAYLIFVIPLAETLFFRGVLQESRPFWLVGLLSSLWSGLVFFPMLDIRRYPAVAVIIGTALVVMNMIYSYVRQRNGLAAAWLCQLTVNLLLLFLPLL